MVVDQNQFLCQRFTNNKVFIDHSLWINKVVNTKWCEIHPGLML